MPHTLIRRSLIVSLAAGFLAAAPLTLIATRPPAALAMTIEPLPHPLVTYAAPPPQMAVQLVEVASVIVTPTPTPVPTVVPTIEPVRAKTLSLPNGSHEDWMAAAGIPSADWPHVESIISRESGWCPTKWNGQIGVCPAVPSASGPGSSAFGLCQSLPANKMASAGADYMTNPVTQLRWCDSYARSRYGGWAQAVAFWHKNKYW